MEYFIVEEGYMWETILDILKEKAMEMAKSMGASPEALKKMEAGMKANKERSEEHTSELQSPS